ncbi:hypothetical protein [Streptomyces flavidovirens]|uniref:hypothetical protein n=1 Tax=Streptomyces flavidovirens TaxID=67298 RepID=UPI00244BA062|nr:hypothetical protein [Streptomyces flavidovirens]
MTATQLGLPLPVVVFDSGGYGEIRDEMNARRHPDRRRPATRRPARAVPGVRRRGDARRFARRSRRGAGAGAEHPPPHCHHRSGGESTV